MNKAVELLQESIDIKEKEMKEYMSLIEDCKKSIRLYKKTIERMNDLEGR
jgi:peptidoglycan hydrolase CwlO-like protein